MPRYWLPSFLPFLTECIEILITATNWSSDRLFFRSREEMNICFRSHFVCFPYYLLISDLFFTDFFAYRSSLWSFAFETCRGKRNNWWKQSSSSYVQVNHAFSDMFHYVLWLDTAFFVVPVLYESIILRSIFLSLIYF